MWGGPILGRGQLATEGESKGLSALRHGVLTAPAASDSRRRALRAATSSWRHAASWWVPKRPSERLLKQHASLQLTCCSPHYTHVQSCRRWP